MYAPVFNEVYQVQELNFLYLEFIPLSSLCPSISGDNGVACYLTDFAKKKQIGKEILTAAGSEKN